MEKIDTLLAVMVILLVLAAAEMNGFFAAAENSPTVAWYVVAKRLNYPDFLEKAAKYKPDIVILTVYAEDDIIPMNGKDISLRHVVDELHSHGIKVYYSFSLFSRSALSFEQYMQKEAEGIPLSEQKIHMADYAGLLRETNQSEYQKWFGFYLQNGLDPESIPRVMRKPVEGFYVEPGHYTSIDPLYKPYREYMVRVINRTIQEARPDGLAFDHIRFFTFDQGYNQDIRDYILNETGLDVYEHFPKPFFQLDAHGWSENDRAYYDSRARLIEHAVGDIVLRFPEFESFGTTFGSTVPGRSNGQYVELQDNVFDALLVMAYDTNESEVARNIKETSSASEARVILGIFPFGDRGTIFRNIEAGLRNGADGVYLLGYGFDEEVHSYLLNIRNKN